METKIYVVMSSEGEWEDHRSWMEKAFRNKEDAEAYAKEMDARHFLQPVVDEDLWDEAENLWYYTNEQQYGEDWEQCPYDWQTEREKCEQFFREQEERKALYMRDYINAHGSRQFTLDDINRHQQYDDNIGYNWYPCLVEEVTLVE